MNFKKEDLIKYGFQGFNKISEIRKIYNIIPAHKGVYLVYRNSLDTPEFINPGTGGYFKKKNPNVLEPVLKDNWINNEKVLYIGKAGSFNNNSSLYERIKLYVKFGYGENVGHRGGRYIWQLSDSEDLLIAYKELDDVEPREEEKKLLNLFMGQNDGKLPFANLRR